MIYFNVSILPGLLRVALAVYGVVDQKLMYLKWSNVENKKTLMSTTAHQLL